MPDDFPDRPPTRAASRQTPTPVRSTEVRAASIKPRVRIALWAKTAGGCTLCNRRVLNDTRSYWHTVAAAERAHNLGATRTAGSPRGLEELDRAIDLEDNLLLCCHDCHRMIDDERGGEDAPEPPPHLTQLVTRKGCPCSSHFDTSTLATTTSSSPNMLAALTAGTLVFADGATQVRKRPAAG
jgi:hypothetical protein